ncbi:hypothetical protein [Pseudomonas sp. 10-1B]|nr:hypothetical protein [Pseudomonas sp. 10-1B]
MRIAAEVFGVSGCRLVRLDEIGYGEGGERPKRNTLFERDAIGRLIL